MDWEPVSIPMSIMATTPPKISTFGYHEIHTVRRSFIYGLMFISIPLLFWNGIDMERNVFTAENIFNLLFLGVFASALCFVLWNIAVKKLGAMKTSVFIYLVPVVTVIASSIILKESLSALSVLGTVLTLAGLFLSSH